MAVAEQVEFTKAEMKLLLRCISNAEDMCDCTPESVFDEAELDAMEDSGNAHCDPIWDSLKKKVDALPVQK